MSSSLSDLRFDPATLDDLPALTGLLALLFTQEADFLPETEKQQRALRMILEDRQRGCIYVARRASEVIGMVSTLYTVSTASGGQAAWLEDMVLLPDCRGQGIGAALLRHAICAARDAGVLRLTLLTDPDNAAAQAIYAAEGFKFSAMQAMRLTLR